MSEQEYSIGNDNDDDDDNDVRECSAKRIKLKNSSPEQNILSVKHGFQASLTPNQIAKLCYDTFKALPGRFILIFSYFLPRSRMIFKVT